MVEIASFVLDVVKCLAAPIGRPFKYLYNYNTNLKNLEKEVTKLKNTRDEVQVKVTAAERNVEEIKQNVKDWQTDVEKIITEAQRLVEEKEKNPRCFKGLCSNCITPYKHSKKAFKLKRDDIGPLLLQEEKFDGVSHPTTLLSNYEKNFDKLRDDVLKLKNARLKVQRKVVGAKNNEEEIEEDVKKWLEDVDSNIVKAEELIENQSSIGTDCKARCQKSKAASELMVDVIGPLLRQEERFDKVSYSTVQLSNYEKNFDKLRDGVLKLKNGRLKVQHKIEEAKNNVEEIEEDVKKWLEDVDSIIVKAEELIENQSSIGTDSKAASDLMVDNIGPLLQQEERFHKVSHPTIHKEIWLVSNEDYLAFESRNSTVNNVWDALQDEKIYMMGVYGMGGLGKTTLVQEIGRKAEKDKLFDEIVFVEVTETLDVKKIQTEIADKLGVKFNNQSERANKLYQRLRNNKKILLILDNVWEDLDLKTIGIPFKTDRGGCKIMFTTRNLDALQKMGSTSNFGMGILEEEEAWNLFMKMAGNVIHACELNSLPKDVCMECGGLPIVICTIAKALRNKSRLSTWKVALQELKAPSPTNFVGFLKKEYVKIALSYKYLRDDELKKTFLISSLMKNNTSISNLFRHVTGLDILEGANLKMEDARDRLDKLICELKDSCLLLDGFTTGQFSMHDVIRAVAITIAYTNHHVFTERNDVEKEWKDKDKLKKCTKISLPHTSTIISQLWPEYLDCPNLEYFCMTNMWNASFQIPKDFFTVMPKLKVLNLFEMQQSSLPLSLDLLTNLQTLCLDQSKIEDVVIIGKLKKLKVLSLRHSYIKELPIEIGQLTQLKILDLRYCWQLKYIAPNVISKLLQLEELYLKGCCIQWKVEIVEEFKHLTQVTSLTLVIRDDIVLPQGFFSRDLKRYEISVGHWLLDPQEREFTRVLKFKFISTISLEDLRRIKNVEFLWLTESLDVDNGLYNFEMRPLFEEQVIFPDLKVLALTNINYRKIWDSQLPTFSCQNLTKMTLMSCGNIKYVFPSSIAKSLQQLQELKIRDCKVLEEIVAKEEEANAVVNFVFPNITILWFEGLPQLTNFYPEMHALKLPMLKELVVIDCVKFASEYLSFQEKNEGEIHISDLNSLLLHNKVIFPDLKVLALLDINYRNIWDSQLPTSSCQNLTLVSCGNIKYVFSSFMVKSLRQLQELKIEDCQILEEIVAKEEVANNQLPTSSYQNLTKLTLTRCDNIKYVFPSSIAKNLQQLQELKITYCKVLEEIVAKEEGANTIVNFVFPNVTLLKLECLPQLTTFYPGMHTLELPILKELVVIYCDKFASKYLRFQENDKEGETHISEPKSLFLDNKINSDLEELELKNIKWQNQSKTLEIKFVKSTNIPVGFLERFENLEGLKLIHYECKEIFSYGKDEEQIQITLGSSSASFQNLKVLSVYNCYWLIKLITPLTARGLTQLREMSIEYCRMLIEIVEDEGDATRSIEIVFNNLKKLSLEQLESLTCFCYGNYSVNFPSLEELIIRECPNMNTFSKGILSTPKLYKIKYDWKEKYLEDGGSELNTTIQQAHKKKVDSELKELRLTLSRRDIMSIRQEEFQESFGKVKTLQLVKDEYVNIPIQIIHKFNSLEKLILKVSLYEEIFSSEEDEEHVGALTKLKVLELHHLFNLKYFWKQDSQLNSILQNLDCLEVYFCDNLMTLLPCSTSFENLTTLRVSYCNGMQNLMSFSIAKSLVRLRFLSIMGCEMMIEVLANEGDIKKCEIVFEKLKELYLYCLESLTCFCSGDYTLKFPNLKSLYVDKCFKMKTFFEGGLSMPRLQELNSKACSESDIDTIIQQLGATQS